MGRIFFLNNGIDRVPVSMLLKYVNMLVKLIVAKREVNKKFYLFSYLR